MAPSDGGNKMESWLIGVVASMAVLAVTAVALRLISRQKLRRRLWWDDWAILASMIWYFIHLSLVFTMGAKDLNSPYTAPDDAGAAVLQLLVVLQVIYIWNMCLTKVSVLLWYYRTFQLWFMSRFYLVLLGAVVLACTVAVSFVSVFMCAPVQKLWHQNMDGRCLDYVNVWIAKAAMAVSTDLAVVLFPLPHVFTLNLGLAEKASVAFLFAMGFFVVFTSAYHYTLLFSAGTAGFAAPVRAALGWTSVEISSGITAACLPLLGPLFGPILNHRPKDASATAMVPSVLGDNDDGDDEDDDDDVADQEPTFAMVAVLSGPGDGYGDEDGFEEWRLPTEAAAAKRKGLSAAADDQDDNAAHRRQRPQHGGRKGKRSGKEQFSSADAWDWERNVESLTRADELVACQHEASATRVEHAGPVEVPEHGISVTTDFRRFSVAAPVEGKKCVRKKR